MTRAACFVMQLLGVRQMMFSPSAPVRTTGFWRRGRCALPVLVLLCGLAAAAPAGAQSHAADIRTAQQALAARGFDVGTIDGRMGDRTRRALQDFQRRSGLPVTGLADAETLRRLTSPPATPPVAPGTTALPAAASPLSATASPPAPQAPAVLPPADGAAASGGEEASPAVAPPPISITPAETRAPAASAPPPKDSGGGTGGLVLLGLCVLIGWLLVRRARAKRARLAATDANRSPPPLPVPPPLPGETAAVTGSRPRNQPGHRPASDTPATSAASRAPVRRSIADPPEIAPGTGALDQAMERLAALGPSSATPASGSLLPPLPQTLMDERWTKAAPKPAPDHETETPDWSNLGLGRSASPPAAPSTPAPAAPVKNDSWLPAGRSVRIAGFQIEGGLLYVGRHLPRLDGNGTENCLIDPGLPVRSGPAPWAMSYFPSYERIEPTHRHAYLAWLAGGRSDPSVEMGLVFLYFYGLERRLLGDRSLAEAPAILAEVRRLRDLYGENASFRRYSGALLEMADLLDGTIPDTPPEGTDQLWDTRLALKVGLGARVAAGLPLDGAWMLAWLRSDPDTSWRAPATRLPGPFRTLFLRSFDTAFPKGLAVKMPRRTLSLDYHACSGTFSVTVTPKLGNEPLPDISGLSAPLARVRPLAEAAMVALEPLSRFVGRNPEKADSIEAFALLPAELRDTPPPGVAALRTWLTDATRAGPMQIPFPKALHRLLGTQPEKPGKRELQTLAATLALVGHGVEPDPAFGGRTPKAGEPVVLFALGDVAPATPSESYRNALLRLTLAVLVAGADGSVADSERTLLASHIADAPDLSAGDRLRLAAHLHWLEACPPDTSGLKARTASLPMEARDAIGRLAILMAGADGRVDADEVRLLQKLYRALGLDPATLYADLHALGADDAPAPQSAPVATGAPASAPPSAASAGVQLDLDRIRRIQADTALVSSVLGAVFTDEVTEPEPPPPPEPDTGPDAADDNTPFDGLDLAHGRLLRELVAEEEWSREDYTRLARSLDLMPDGAIETLNEWAYGQFDEAVIEDGDPLTVIRSLLSVPEPAAHV